MLLTRSRRGWLQCWSSSCLRLRTSEVKAVDTPSLTTRVLRFYVDCDFFSSNCREPNGRLSPSAYKTELSYWLKSCRTETKLLLAPPHLSFQSNTASRATSSLDSDVLCSLALACCSFKPSARFRSLLAAASSQSAPFLFLDCLPFWQYCSSK